MKVYYINKLDSRLGDHKVTPIYSTKEGALEYAKKHILNESGRDEDDFGVTVENIVSVIIKGNIIKEHVTTKVYGDSQLSDSWSWEAEFELIEEDVL